MINSRSLKVWGLAVGLLLIVGIVGALVISRVNVAYANGFVSRQSLELRLKQVQFAYDLEALGTAHHDPNYAVNERRGILEQMIAERFLLKEASKKGIAVSEEERQGHVTEIVTWLEQHFFGSREALVDFLATYNLNMADLESYLTETLPVYKLREALTKDIVITDSDAKLFYEAHQDEFNIPELIRVSHILVRDLALADDILSQLKAGKDFAELAKTHSTDTESAVLGGDLNYNARGAFVEAFDAAAWALTKPGELSEIVQTSYGYHIIKLDERLGARERSYDEVEELVKEHLREELEMRMWVNYLDELRGRSRIFIFLK